MHETLDAHATPNRKPVFVVIAWAVHRPPLKCAATGSLPPLPRAVQSVLDGHETATRPGPNAGLHWTDQPDASAPDTPASHPATTTTQAPNRRATRHITTPFHASIPPIPF